MFTRLPGMVLLAAACFIGGWMMAGALPFQLKQDVVRTTTGATMPTTSRSVGNAICHGGFAMICVAAGVSAALALRASRFPVWVAAASWVVLLSSLAIRHFSPIVEWAMLPLGYLTQLGVAHGWAARRMNGRNELDSPSAGRTRRRITWAVAAAMLLCFPCAVGVPYVGGGVGPLPKTFYLLVTDKQLSIAAIVIWSIYATIFGVLAAIVARQVAGAWSLFSSTTCAALGATALVVLVIVAVRFPTRPITAAADVGFANPFVGFYVTVIGILLGTLCLIAGLPALLVLGRRKPQWRPGCATMLVVATVFCFTSAYFAWPRTFTIALLAAQTELDPKNAEAAVTRLTRMMDDPDVATRVQAMQALREAGPVAKAAVPALTERLDDPERSVRWSAAEALGNIGPAAQPAIPALLQRLTDADAAVRREAAHALWKITGDAEAILPTVVALASDDRNSYQRDEAALLLAEIAPEHSRTVPALVEALKGHPSFHPEPAARALGNLGPAAKDAIPALRTAADSKYPRVQQAAREALRKLGAGEASSCS